MVRKVAYEKFVDFMGIENGVIVVKDCVRIMKLELLVCEAKAGAVIANELCGIN